MNWLIPFDQFEIQTSEPRHMLVGRLSPYVEPRKFRWLRKPAEHAFFEGKLDENGFAISRILEPGERNVFRPVVVGRLIEAPVGTIVEITLRLNWSVVMFVAGYWMLFVCYGAGVLIHGPPQQSPEWILGFVPGVALYAFCLYGFHGEGLDNKAAIVKVLTAAEYLPP